MTDPEHLYRRAAERSGAGDKQAAADLLEQATARGHAAAGFTLGTFLLDGVAGRRDAARALALFRQAQDRGNAAAGHAALILEALGLGLPEPDIAGALGRLARLAHAGDACALRSLAVLWRLAGDGARASGLIERAATGGDAMARLLRRHFDAANPGRDADPEPLSSLPTPPPPAAEILSSDPDLRRYPGFLPPILCDYLTAKAAPLLQPSQIFDPGTGARRPDPWRRSLTAILHPLDQDPVTLLIDRMISEATEIPMDQGELLSVLSYGPGEEYRRHLDALPDDKGAGSLELARAGQRIATFLILLQSDFTGGETDFPTLGIRLRPQKGGAVFFRNVDSEDRPDPRLLHAGLPVSAGRKWLASKWLRARPLPL